MPVRIRQYCETDYSASGSSDLYQRGELQQLIKETAAKYKSEEPDAE